MPESRHTDARAPVEMSSTPEKRRRTVEWDEANLAKNFAERSATMKIDEIETPWHSPPRELFHDLRVEDEGRAPAEEVAERERRHAEVMRKLHDVIRADVRGDRDGVGEGEAEEREGRISRRRLRAAAARRRASRFTIPTRGMKISGTMRRLWLSEGCLRRRERRFRPRDGRRSATKRTTVRDVSIRCDFFLTRCDTQFPSLNYARSATSSSMSSISLALTTTPEPTSPLTTLSTTSKRCAVALSA